MFFRAIQITPLVLLVFLKGALSASAVSRLSCDVKPLPGGLYQYQLNPDPGPNCGEQGWEDDNQTALTLGCKFEPDLVHSLTNRTVVLKKCLDFAHFSAQCPGFVEAKCTFDCSSVRADPVVKSFKNESDVVKPPNSVCFGEKCFDKTPFALVLSAILFTVLLIIFGSWGFYKYKKRCGQKDLQHRAELGQPQTNQELRPLRDQMKPDVPDNALPPAVHEE